MRHDSVLRGKVTPELITIGCWVLSSTNGIAVASARAMANLPAVARLSISTNSERVCSAPGETMTGSLNTIEIDD